MNEKTQILIVDDDGRMARTLVDILRIKGFAAQVARSGLEALQKVQAMPRGGQLTLTAPLAAPPAAAGVVSLAVIDTGEGIAPEDLPKLFEPLFTTKPKGIGLGLTITKMLVEANGGTVEVTSEAGRGATLQLTLPMEGEPV